MQEPERLILRRYLLAHVPSWALASGALWAFHQWFAFPPLAVAALVGVVVMADLLAYPRMRRYYRSEPATLRMLGQLGEAVTPIDPSGLARVRGELWQVTSTRPIDAGARMRVLEVRGLSLLVEPA